MAKDRQQYLEKISTYQSSIDSMLRWEAKALKDLPLDIGPDDLALTQIKLAKGMIDLTSYYIVMSEISRAMLDVRSEEALENARKTITKALSYMENVVSAYLDVPVSDYQDRLDLIENVDSKERYELVRKLSLACELLSNAYGENSRWQWALLDLCSRSAIITKNFFDMKNAVTNMDLTSKNYEGTFYHLVLLKRSLSDIADKYREKYEISGNVATDILRGIDFLAALRRVHLLLGEAEEAENARKKADIWQKRLDADIKAKDSANHQ